MSFVINGVEALSNGDNYTFISKHHLPSKYGSIWIISLQDEFNAADNSIKKGYIETLNNGNNTTISYNFVIKNGNISIVGSNRYSKKLKLCKFVNSSAYLWHGYPADYCKNQQDKPNQNTLLKMYNDNLIDKRMVSKISGGKR